MKRFSIILGLSLLLPQLTGRFESVAGARSHSVTVTAGKFNRRDTVVSFDLPADARGAAYSLRDEAGNLTPLQVDSRHHARFVIKELKAGSSKSFTLEAGRTAAGAAGVEATKEGDSLKITLAGREVLQYRGGKGELPGPNVKPLFRRAGYIHPVSTPSGRVVTDDYPPNHLHHHGIWFPWTKTEFEGRHPDFWNMGDGTGSVEFVSLDEVWSGAVDAGFQSRHRFIDLSATPPKAALNETWEVTIYNVGQGTKPYRLFDLVSTQECASGVPLVLPEYHYGGLGFRGNRQWDGKENAIFLTSEGYDRADGHATRSRWCHVGGRIDGELAGVAILGHPGNFRAPQPMRIHPTEPFFCYAPSQMGRWGISPGHPYVSRYRFIVYDGPPDVGEIERLWNDYASPPTVTIK